MKFTNTEPMPSEPVKIDSGLHEEVKEFVDESSRYSSYKSFYEDAVRRRLDEEKQTVDEIQKQVDELKEKLDM